MASHHLGKNAPTKQAPKANAGAGACRPKVLEDKNSRAFQIMEHQKSRLTKKGKANIATLPQGVQDSIKNKARIEGVLNSGVESASIEELKSKYDIGKPLTIKTARVITQQRNEFFAQNRNKAHIRDEQQSKKSSSTTKKMVKK